MDIHSSGHATVEELKDAIRAIKPKFMIPAHGYYFMRAANRELATTVGVKRENILLLDNGQTAEITKTSARVTDKTVDAFPIFVDGLGVGDVGEIVLRDRRMLSEGGMIVVIATIGRKNGRLLKNPDIISRGFIYLKDNREMLNDIRKRIRGIIDRTRNQKTQTDYLK